jgi:hypothetical protein
MSGTSAAPLRIGLVPHRESATGAVRHPDPVRKAAPAPRVGAFSTARVFSKAGASAITASGDDRVVAVFSTTERAVFFFAARPPYGRVGAPLALSHARGPATSLVLNHNGTVAAVGTPFSFPNPSVATVASLRLAHSVADDFDTSAFRCGTVSVHARYTLGTASWFLVKAVASPTPRNTLPAADPRNAPGGARFGYRVTADGAVSVIGASSHVVAAPIATLTSAALAAPSLVRRKDLATDESFSQFGRLPASGITPPNAVPPSPAVHPLAPNAVEDPLPASLVVSGDGATIALAAGGAVHVCATSVVEDGAIGDLPGSFASFRNSAGRRARILPRSVAAGTQFGEAALDYHGDLLAVAALARDGAAVHLYDLTAASVSRPLQDAFPAAGSSGARRALPFAVLEPPHAAYAHGGSSQAVSRVAAVRVSGNGLRVAVVWPQLGLVSVYSVFRLANRVAPASFETAPRVAPSWSSARGTLPAATRPPTADFAVAATDGALSDVSFSNYAGTGILVAAGDGTFRGARLLTSSTYERPPAPIVAPYSTFAEYAADPMVASGALPSAVTHFGLASAPPPRMRPVAPREIPTAADSIVAGALAVHPYTAPSLRGAAGAGVAASRTGLRNAHELL